MKKVLITCLLGMGVLLPTEMVKSSVIYYSRIVDVAISGWVLTATSNPEDGTISTIEIIRASTMEVVLTQSCSGYSCAVGLSGLPGGVYIAKVTCTNTTYSKQFKW